MFRLYGQAAGGQGEMFWQATAPGRQLRPPAVPQENSGPQNLGQRENKGQLCCPFSIHEMSTLFLMSLFPAIIWPKLEIGI